MSDNDLIPMEDDGGPVALPPEFSETPAQETAPVQAEPAQPPAQPAAEPVEDPDEPPAVRGLKAELSRTREEARRWRDAATVIKTKLDERPEVVEYLRTGKLPQAQQAQPQQPVVAQRSAEEERELVAIAKDIGIYTPEGQPDIEAVARMREYNRRDSERIAREAAAAAIKPFKEERVTTQAQQMRKEAVETAEQFGLPREFSEPIIEHLVGQHPELAADANNMSTALLVAAGVKYMQEFQQRKSAPAAQPQTIVSPPVYREGGTGGRSSAPTMSALEKRTMQQIGGKEDEWLAHVGKLANITDATKLITMETD